MVVVEVDIDAVGLMLALDLPLAADKSRQETNFVIK